MPTITIGTAQSQPGKITYGTFDAVPLPTGGVDAFPVIIAQGHNSEGPVLWLTANIHGDEYNGIAVLHHLITPDLIQNLSGTVVVIPTLSPAGLRTNERSPYYLHGKDPNRLFPGSPNLERIAARASTPLALELAYARLFERIDATADYLIDLHDYGIQSIPFAIRDPVFYREPRDRASANKLHHAVGDMLEALGLTIVNEYASKRYIDMNLHRSVSGATLNRARIPAITIEIGGFQQVNQLHIQAVIVGLRNVMRWARILPGDPEEMPNVPIIAPGYPIRRATHPRVPLACIVHRLVEPGDEVEVSQPVARMVDIYGRPMGPDDGLLRSEHRGFVLGTFSNIAVFPNEAVFGLGIRDHNNLVVQVPKH